MQIRIRVACYIYFWRALSKTNWILTFHSTVSDTSKTNIISYLIDITLFIAQPFSSLFWHTICINMIRKDMACLWFIETTRFTTNDSIFKTKKNTDKLQNESENVAIDADLQSFLDFCNNINPWQGWLFLCNRRVSHEKRKLIHLRHCFRYHQME